MKNSAKPRNAKRLPKRAAGFSLIELMIGIVIIGILLAIAIPAYQSSVYAAHRSDAKTALLDLAGREEKYFSVNNSYTSDPTQLYGANQTSMPTTQSGGVTTYALSISPSSPTTSYTATATPQGNQANDACGSFSVTNTGYTSVTGSGNCW